ncbi:MAG: Clostripain family, partial [Blastocatellia bacterium]|nr:Clostripain family [Blastocatellia bacterium]
MPETKDREKKEWTLMFYFASDNPLAPNIVPQLKAIKNAGFHQSVNVIAQFDPEVEGMPTQIFDVNLANKLAYPDQLSFNPAGNDPFVRSLVMDKLWGSGPNDEKMRAKIARHLSETRGGAKYDPPIPPNDESADRDELGPKKSLPYFLQFCAKNYPARHFMLFILGHGLVVGNHMFLFDANADEATISLADLAQILNQFKKDTKDIGEFDLVSFHSCSMSSLELAYELQGTANYMLA